MRLEDFYDMVQGIDEYRVYSPKSTGMYNYDRIVPPLFPVSLIDAEINEVVMQSEDEGASIIAIVYLK